MLERLGHQVQIDTTYRGAPCDLMIAIHAWRSAPSVQAVKAVHPNVPLVVLLAGTDIYRYQHTDRETTLRTMMLADRLVGLHSRVHLDIPAELGKRLCIIYQSCAPLTRARQPLKRFFQVCVVGHLRVEKDPLRAAFAARRLRGTSKLRVILLGAAHDEDWAERARTEARDNPRFIWRGEVSRAQVRRCFSESHAMVMSSIMEGGANVVSEAIVAGLPVIASDISGNRGLLGDQHGAYFKAKDEIALAHLLQRAESDPYFLAELAMNALKDARRFHEDVELESWRGLLGEITRER